MIDLERFKEGMWHSLPPKYPNMKLKIKPLGRKNMVECRARSRQIRDDHLSIEPDLGVFTWESFCEAVEDWKGIPIPEGEKYSREQILEALFEEDDIVDFVLEKAVKNYQIKEKQLGNEIKNSGSSQDG